ncbi:MAG: hypothetical protein HYY01_14165 [Chloroflexi bacterium]|nr:hypothetical protein [Chloroflexota bacterium]
MRRLLYVPIVHSQADLGDAGTGLADRSSALAGERRWRLHAETVDRFWDSMATYLRTLDITVMVVYQDGLPAGGEAGRRIVEEAARRGSRNYRLVLDLLHSGAELRKTEDPALLWQERENLLSLLGQGTAPGDTQQYRQRRDSLTQERDQAVAEAINASLKEGELAVLFMGAYHDVLRHLAEDIAVEMVKDPADVRAYFEALFDGRDDGRLEALAQRLASPQTPSVILKEPFAALEGELRD